MRRKRKIKENEKEEEEDEYAAIKRDEEHLSSTQQASVTLPPAQALIHGPSLAGAEKASIGEGIYG